MRNGDYSAFLAAKRIETRFAGLKPKEPHPILFDFQRDLVKWALRRGRACLFEDCGLGKTFQQPLAVADQTVKEAAKVDCLVRYCRSQSEVKKGITITNYEMLENTSTRRNSKALSWTNRRSLITERVARNARNSVNAEALTAAINGAVQVQGSESIESRSSGN